MRFILLLLLAPCILHGQEPSLPEDLLESMQQDQDMDVTQLPDNRFADRNIIDLQTVLYDQLIGAGLLNDTLALNFINYRNRFGSIVAWEELLQVEGFTPELILMLKSRCTLEPPRLPGKSGTSFEMINRFSLLLAQSQGYISGAYNGSRIYALNKLICRKPGQFTWGILGEKDAGEKLFPNRNVPLTDHTSAFVRLQVNRKWLREVIAGDYHLSAGPGLLLSSGLTYGKSSMTLAIDRKTEPLSPSLSVNETHFLRGIAITLGKEEQPAVVFYSRKKTDGQIAADGTISLRQGGLHRTEAELQVRKKMDQEVAGMLKYWKMGKVEAGLSALSYRLGNGEGSIDQPDLSAGLHMRYQLAHGYLFGETALKKKSNGTLVGIVQGLSNKTAVSAVYRRYSSSFSNPLGAAFAAGQNQGEEGLYTGLEHQFTGRLKLNLYIDQYYQPPDGSEGKPAAWNRDMFCQLTFARRKSLTLYSRVRFQIRPKIDASEILKQNLDQQRIYYRLHGEQKISEVCTLRTRMEFHHRREKTVTGRGWLIYQDVILHPVEKDYKVVLRYALFDIPDYNDRIYAFENDVLYSYSIPAYYYTGQRMYILGCYQFSSAVDGWIRLSCWNYSGRTSIGSGNDMIAGHRKPEITLQLRVQL